MNVIERAPATPFGAAHVAAAAIAAWIAYVAVGGLDTIGRHFVVLGSLRVVLFGALLAFAIAVGVHTRGLGRAGLIVAALGAAAYLLGGIGSVATDGWSYDVFGDEGPASPPWYAYVLGLSGIAFALGTLLVGIAGRSAGRLAVAVILAGALFPVAFAADGYGHVLWLMPWLALAVGSIVAPPASARR